MSPTPTPPPRPHLFPHFDNHMGDQTKNKKWPKKKFFRNFLFQFRPYGILFYLYTNSQNKTVLWTETLKTTSLKERLMPNFLQYKIFGRGKGHHFLKHPKHSLTGVSVDFLPSYYTNMASVYKALSIRYYPCHREYSHQKGRNLLHQWKIERADGNRQNFIVPKFPEATLH